MRDHRGSIHPYLGMDARVLYESIERMNEWIYIVAPQAAAHSARLFAAQLLPTSALPNSAALQHHAALLFLLRQPQFEPTAAHRR